MTVLLERSVSPSREDSDLARESSRRLSPHRGKRLRVEIPKRGKEADMVPVPPAAIEMLVRILTEMAAGNAVTLIPTHAELTTREAASILNVSRPFLVQLLESGAIPFRKVGAHRRVRADDLIAFKQKSDDDRERALGEMAALSQETGGY